MSWNGSCLVQAVCGRVPNSSHTRLQDYVHRIGRTGRAGAWETESRNKTLTLKRAPKDSAYEKMWSGESKSLWPDLGWRWHRWRWGRDSPSPSWQALHGSSMLRVVGAARSARARRSQSQGNHWSHGADQPGPQSHRVCPCNGAVSNSEFYTFSWAPSFHVQKHADAIWCLNIFKFRYLSMLK